MSVVGTFPHKSAAEYARDLFRSQGSSWGDEAKTLEKIGRWVGMSPRSVKRLIKGETKSASETIRERFRRVYISECERQMARLQEILAIERTRDADAVDENLLAEVQALAAKVLAAKGR